MKIKHPRRKILITGRPGVGKTTLFIRLYEELRVFNPIGFYTSEIRENNIRKGFELVSFNGIRKILSHVRIKGRTPFEVGKYGVDIDTFDNFLDMNDFYNPDHDLIMIDEIGKMECFSMKFQKLIGKLIEADRAFISTIAHKGGGVINDIKNHSNVKLFEITKHNRNSKLFEIINYFNE